MCAPVFHEDGVGAGECKEEEEKLSEAAVAGMN